MAATAAFIAAGVICGFIPFCWCCYFYFLLGLYAVAIAACQTIPQ